MSEIALSLPFTINAYGNLSTTTDQHKIWSDRVRFTIGTNLYERILNPKFGTLLPEAFMETAETAEVSIVSEVQRAFATQLELLTLEKVDVSFDETTGTTHVSILYKLPNEEEVSTTIGVTYIGGTNPSVQENL